MSAGPEDTSGLNRVGQGSPRIDSLVSSSDDTNTQQNGNGETSAEPVPVTTKQGRGGDLEPRNSALALGLERTLTLGLL